MAANLENPNSKQGESMDLPKFLSTLSVPLSHVMSTPKATSINIGSKAQDATLHGEPCTSMNVACSYKSKPHIYISHARKVADRAAHSARCCKLLIQIVVGSWKSVFPQCSLEFQLLFQYLREHDVFKTLYTKV